MAIQKTSNFNGLSQKNINCATNCAMGSDYKGLNLAAWDGGLIIEIQAAPAPYSRRLSRVPSYESAQKIRSVHSYRGIFSP